MEVLGNGKDSMAHWSLEICTESVLLADIQLRENELGGRKIYKRKQHGF
jgi:hypothetical protein